MTNAADIHDIFDIQLDPDAFATPDVPGMPDSIYEQPHEFFESLRQHSGDVVEVVDGKVDGNPFPFFGTRDRTRPVYVVLGFKTIQSVLSNQSDFHQNYSEHMGVLMGENVIVGLNPPVHRKYRGLVNQAFGMQSVNALTHQIIEPLIDGILDRIVANQRSDLVQDLACRLPVFLIGHIFDLPPSQYADFAKCAGTLMAAGFNWPAALKASQELESMFQEIIAYRRAHPGEDIISRLINARLDGDQLTDSDIVSFCRALLPAGMETTVRALTSLFAVLMTQPEHWRRLNQDNSLIPAAVEEVIRWNGPAQTLPKTPTRDVVLDGHSVPAGASLWIYIGHANRDPRHWDQPHQYELTRPKAMHLGFSFGQHMCLGNVLARRELELTLREMLHRLPDLRLDPDLPTPRIRGVISRSASSVHVLARS